MPSSKFYLKDNKKPTTLISLTFRYEKKRLVISTGIKINPAFWDKDKQRVKMSRNYPIYKQVNANLDRLDGIVQQAYNEFLYKDIIPTVAQLRYEIDKARGKAIVSSTNFIDFFQECFNVMQETGKLSGRNISETRIRGYKSTLNYVRQFHQNERRIDFNDIDYEFAIDFTEYLYNNTKSKSVNTIWAHFQKIRVIMNYANEKEITNSQKYKSKRFMPKEVTTSRTYLTVKELTDLFYLDLEKHERLERVRDWLMISCFTALRFSDANKLKKEHIRTAYDEHKKPFEVITIMQNKTEGSVTIPLHPYAKHIIDKYDGKIPEPISNQKTNEYLKELCELAGITEGVMMKKNVKGKNYEVKMRKCDTISSHTGRRSGASNLYIAGVPERSIMKLTGHKDKDAFLRYIRVTDEQNAILIAKSSFFDVKLRKVI